jgi:hypothetical protein
MLVSVTIRTMMTASNDIIRIISVVVVPEPVSIAPYILKKLCIPVKGQVVAWGDLDCIRSWHITHNIAS